MKSSVRGAGRWIALLSAAALLAEPAAAKTKKKDLPFTIIPAVGESTDVGPGVEEIRVFRDGLDVRVSFVTGITRRRMMQATLGLDGDPFATPSGQPVRFRTFVVYLENTSGTDLHFNPQVARVLTDHDDFAYAMDYSDIYMKLHRALTLDQITQIVYDKAFLLSPGNKTKKLLVFPEIPGEKWNEFQLILTFEREGLAQNDLPVRFRKLYLDEAP